MSADRVDAFVERIRATPLPHAPGLPPDARGLSTTQVAGRGWRLADLPTPVAVLDLAAVEHNLRTMAAWCAEHGVTLCPHGKTTMAPQLFARQLAHGVIGLTAATPAQVRTMRDAGVPRVMLANELVQDHEAQWIAHELAGDPDFAFSCWVDSPAGVDVVERAGAAAGVTMDVLVEFGWPGGRGGCRTLDDCTSVAERIASSPHVRLTGVAGYEGAVAGDRTPESLAAVRDYLRALRHTASRLREAGRFTTEGPITLTAGGSMFFDLVAEQLGAGPDAEAFATVLRSGCYIAHDHGMFARNTPWAELGTPLQAALTVWASVLSVQDGTAFLDAGRRDVSFDQGLPVPLRRRRPGSDEDLPVAGAQITALNDQHAFLRAADLDVRVGDRVELGISHPCTTFDKHALIPVVADDTVVDVVHTFF